MSYALGAILSGKKGHIAPSRYWMLTEDEIKEKSNGCGPGNWKIDLIPDRIGRVDFTESCNIHDVGYEYGQDEEDKRICDRVLLYNLLVDVDRYCIDNGFLDRMQRIAYREATFYYYRAVSDWGNSAFWEGKK